MTIINNIEIDHITYNKNIIKEAIINNDPIEDKLNVIIVISNPCLYASRYILTREFIKRFENEEPNVNLYIVELCYGNQKYYVTKSNNKNHLQLRCNIPLWHKENMINIGIKKLLPSNWKAVAWIDADIEFENTTWAIDTLKVLNGCSDIVQLFSHCVDMDKNKLTMNVFNSFGYQLSKGNQYTSNGINYWHPGYAWACTRKLYDRLGGLYDKGILGSGDNMMAFSFINKVSQCMNDNYNNNYLDSIILFENKCKNIRLGYIPGIIRHYYHGSKKDRKYMERWQILVKYQYNPNLHLTYNNNDLLVPTDDCPSELLKDIFNYFKERNEDSNI